ncbi:MAG: sensor histidine kinase [Actinomycetota bacterium]|nr:sensor histidine kinase [Actinomycetota bacterium]
MTQLRRHASGAPHHGHGRLAMLTVGDMAEDPRAEDPRAEDPRAEDPRAEDPRAEDPRAEDPGGRPLVVRLSIAVWLGFVAGPLSATFSDAHVGVAHLAVVSAVTALFCATDIFYCAMPDPARLALDRRLLGVVVAVLVASVTFLVFYDRPVWAYSYVYCLWPSVVLARSRAWVLPVITGAAVAAGAATGLSAGELFTVGLVVAGVGASIYGITRLVDANKALRQASAAHAAAALREERLRFARDLHELLGHSLSVIALKSQVASRLAASDPARATREMSEIEQITRQALHEVRDAVSGYRRPSLACELEGARRALEAAGIDFDDHIASPPLPAGIEEPLAWALREAVTNVVRHSRATTCTATLDVAAGAVMMTVADDGVGPPRGAARSEASGNGLRGISERVAQVGGALRSGALGPSGGFYLSVSLPLPTETARRPPERAEDESELV